MRNLAIIAILLALTVAASCGVPAAPAPHPAEITATLEVHDTFVKLGWWGQTVAGITINPGSNSTIGGLSPETTYYTYWYLASDGLIYPAGVAVTSPSAIELNQTKAPGRISLGCIKFTTEPEGESHYFPVALPVPD